MQESLILFYENVGMVQVCLYVLRYTVLMFSQWIFFSFFSNRETDGNYKILFTQLCIRQWACLKERDHKSSLLLLKQSLCTKRTMFVYKKCTWVLATSNGVCSGPSFSLLIVSQLESLRLNMGIKRIIFSVKIFKQQQI